MTAPIAIVFCPGRGSYGRGELGSIRRAAPGGAVADALARADAARSTAKQPTISELDAAASFRPSVHLDGRHASELIYFATMSELERVRARYEIAAVAGNSLGWYTALAAAGAISVADGWRLVRTMAELQQHIAGGQVLTTTVDERWQIEATAAAEIERIVSEVGDRGRDCSAAPSIRLGGHVVLAGTEAALEHLLRDLPRRRVGSREFPFRLAGHGPFHTPLCAEIAVPAERELRVLDWRQPKTHLIDGDGSIQSPWSTDPAELLRYTAMEQTVRTFDFTAAVRTALREFNPDACLCLGPGESLRAPVGHVVIAEGYRGIRDRDQLFGAELVRTE